MGLYLGAQTRPTGEFRNSLGRMNVCNLRKISGEKGEGNPGKRRTVNKDLEVQTCEEGR